MQESGLPDPALSPESITTAGANDTRAVLMDSGLSAIGFGPMAEPRNDTAYDSSFAIAHLAVLYGNRAFPANSEFNRDILKKSRCSNLAHLLTHPTGAPRRFPARNYKPIPISVKTWSVDLVGGHGLALLCHKNRRVCKIAR